MIIPPDPEKDPRLFSASASAPSLLLPPGSDIESDITNSDYGYPFNDEVPGGQRYSGEFLPPYERRARALASAVAGREMMERERSPGYIGITIPNRAMDGFAASEGSITPTASTYAAASSSRLPEPSSATTTLPPGSSTAKLWEGSSSSLPRDQPRSARWKGKSRAILGLPTKTERDPSGPTRSQRWWKKWKRWVIAASLVGLLGLGLMIGLLTGLRQPYFREEDKVVQSGPAWHDVEPGDSRWNMAWADGSMNLTWTQGRDSPPPSDGTLIDCNTFTPFNSSDPSTNFTSLSTPYPSNKLWVSTYLIPLQRINMTASPYSIITPDLATNATNLNATNPNNSTYRPKNSSAPPKLPAYPLGLLAQLPIFSRGLASSGTVEFIGSDAAPEVISGGVEDNIRVDVVVQYGGVQGIEGVMRVCELSSDGALGVGVYTPILTDGKMSNPYTLDPTQLPSYHIIIRFPPSLFQTPDGPSPPPKPIYIADMLMRLDKMGVRVGDLEGVVNFGMWNVTSNRGGAVVDYVAAERVWVQTAENAVRGRFNVSKSLYINSTDSSIMADIILHDPTTFLNTSLSRSYVASRGLPSSDTATSLVNGTASALTHNYTHTVNTTFHTTDGLIRVKYLSHPPMTALSSWTSLSSGEMDISVHPNYIGPFAVKNAWGSVRLPPPRERVYDDPLGASRKRAVVLGGIKIEDGSLFHKGGLNETLLPMSGTTITGAAYWQQGPNGTMTPQAVQLGQEGKRGSQMVLLGGWGDVTLRFDGT